MPSFETALFLIVLAGATGVILTRVARGMAQRVGLVDRPDGTRKKQTTPIPVAGGVAVFASTLLTLLAVALSDSAVAAALTADLRKSLALLVSALLITIFGLLDDRYTLSPRYKLVGQLLAVLVLVVGGDFVIHSVGFFGFTMELGSCAVPCTMIWLLACVNALNLIDGMDGFLGTVSGIALVSFAMLAALAGHLFAASVALALAGAVFGFLWWNLPPATVYMGDAGSMLIGLAIGTVSIPASLKGPATVALGAPLAILILPMFDTAAAVVRRKLIGRGLATPDRGHMHHMMMARGLAPSRVLVIVAVLGVVAAVGALGSMAWNNDLFALVSALGVVAVLVVCRLFGNAELGLVRARISRFVRKVLVGDASACGLSVRLQGTADWERVWEELSGIASSLHLQSLRLDVNAPAMHENYHARWNNPVAVREDRLMQLEIPLLDKRGHSLGRLGVAIVRDASPLSEVFATVGTLVEVIERRAATLTNSIPVSATVRVKPLESATETAQPVASRA